MKNTLLFTTILSLIIFASSCNQCYDCTKKCGTCQNGGVIVAGCDGDSILNGYSIESWKALLESQGYTCAYNNDVMNDICGSENKKAMEDNYYDCLKK
ncbi:MAG: hypothetical protein AB7P01_10555 [Bacteroidia bacterium]